MRHIMSQRTHYRLHTARRLGISRFANRSSRLHDLRQRSIYVHTHNHRIHLHQDPRQYHLMVSDSRRMIESATIEPECNYLLYSIVDTRAVPILTFTNMLPTFISSFGPPLMWFLSSITAASSSSSAPRPSLYPPSAFDAFKSTLRQAQCLDSTALDEFGRMHRPPRVLVLPQSHLSTPPSSRGSTLVLP